MWYFNWLKISKKLAYIIAIVILYFVFDSMHILPKFLSISKNTGTRVDMSSSPSVLEEIKPIGELITAEYYGEVYADLLENYQDSISKYGDSIQTYPFQLITQFPALSKYFYDKKKADFKRNLIYIARGSVKIGINLKQLTVDKLNITEQNDSLVIRIPKPEILDININPWYIQNEVAGFEVFKEVPAGTQFTDAEIKAVKQKCKQKLLQEAKYFGLYKKAETNSLKILTRLFSLMTDQEVIVKYLAE